MSVDLSLVLASTMTVVQFAEDALRTEHTAQVVLVRAGVGMQTAGETQRLLTEAREVLPILSAESEMSRIALQGMRTETPQQQFSVNERIDIPNDVTASMDTWGDDAVAGRWAGMTVQQRHVRVGGAL